IRALSVIKSRPYIDITMDLMKKFGVESEFSSKTQIFSISRKQKYQSQNCSVEGDYSNASYFFAAAAILGGKIRIAGLEKNTLQGDKFFLDCLRMMGCQITFSEGSVEVYRDLSQPLNGISVEMENTPDIVQSLCIVASIANSPTSISKISHLKFKEINRIEATATELRKIGVIVETTVDSIKIIPPETFVGNIIETYDDHRMAMSFSIIGLKIPGITIKDPACVEKSFPQFFNYLDQLYKQ
ncbi:MAG: 3-phosphoshikimate 1-carboxyvinyltransferase, partial [Candidatus Heimdallarchaeota archaeon]|nr:3-phosphoshikimate 1-carboxyvinyltransferase [Candidatus Heimdallarchaeota archaeon]